MYNSISSMSNIQKYNQISKPIISELSNKSDNKNQNKTGYMITGIGLTCIAALGLYNLIKHGKNSKTISNKSYDFIQTKTTTTAPQHTCLQTEIINSNYNKTSLNYHYSPYTTRTDEVKIKYIEEEKEIPKNKKKHSVQNSHKPERTYKKNAIPEICSQIRVYMQKMGIDYKNQKINPEGLDEILTNIVGKENVAERPYLENGLITRGRVKCYYVSENTKFVLETHPAPNENAITRLYIANEDKNMRAYLFPDATFRINSWGMNLAHFDTTAKGKRWMDASRFHKNTPNKY